jgi:menaquinone-dependent protoporphyrinogen IX oxidase
MAGSTAEVAQSIGEELTRCGHEVDILPLSQASGVERYAAVVVGGPMIMGWHREALRFLKQHRKDLQSRPLAVFATAMSLTQTGETSLGGVPIWVDENLPKRPQVDGKLNFRERYARLPGYFNPVLRALQPVKPVSIGIFGGRLEYGRLKWWAVLFAMLIIQAAPGERRNWQSIRAWAASLPAALGV